MNETTLAKLLQEDKPGLKLSIYQPTHPASSEQTVREDSIRFKNALKAIQSSDKYDAALEEVMGSLRALVDDIEFWKHQARGLAVFVDQEGYNTVRLHYDVSDAYFIDEQYRIFPLALAQSIGSDYYILGINHTRPRLLAGSPSSCSELMIDGMPGSLESMTDNVEYTNELQHQSGGVGTFHGHSDESALLDNTMGYYRKIAKSVDKYLAGHKEPVLFAGVENRVGLMRKMLSYPHVIDDYIEGNGEAMNEQELHNESELIIEQYNTKRRNDLVNKFQETAPALAVIGVEDVRAAIDKSRVTTLLLPCFRRTTDTVRKGYDASIVLQLRDIEAATTELLVRSTLLQGGEVVAIEIDSFDDNQPRALCRF